MRGAGNWLNVVAPVFGVYRRWTPNLADPAAISAWQHWSMTWMAPIGAVWTLMIIVALARRDKLSVAGWVPFALLAVGFVVVARLLPMPNMG